MLQGEDGLLRGEVKAVTTAVRQEFYARIGLSPVRFKHQRKVAVSDQNLRRTFAGRGMRPNSWSGIVKRVGIVHRCPPGAWLHPNRWSERRLPSIINSVIATRMRLREQVFPDRRRFNLTELLRFPAMSFPDFRERKKKRRTNSTPSRAREAACVLVTKN